MKVLKEQLYCKILGASSVTDAYQYLSMSWLNIQNVSFGGGPVEGQMWDSVTEGKGGLISGQTHYIGRHLWEKMWKQIRLST